MSEQTIPTGYDGPGAGAPAEHVAMWAQARTMADLGECTARWLEGDLSFHPGYYEGPNPETADLVPALAEINRAGFVTIDSQPGGRWDSRVGFGLVEQRAAVHGFAFPPLTGRIVAAAKAAGLRVRVLSFWSDDAQPELNINMPVTRVGGHDCTWAGRWLDTDDFEAIFDWPLNAAARMEVGFADEIEVWDERWGRDDLLWPTLLAAVRSDG